MKNEKGLTLIELLAVIVILAIIAAIAIPAIGNIINNQRDKAILAEVSGAFSAAKIANADGTCASNTCSSTDLAGYLESSKITVESVTFTGTGSSTDPQIVFSLTSPAAFSGKAGTAAGTHLASGKYTMKESQLNAILD